MKVVFIVMLAAGCAACSSSDPSKPAETAPELHATQPAAAAPAPTPASAASTADSVKKYDLKGKVVAINKEAKKVQIDGEDIPGFMMAMTMSYPVKDEHQLDGLSPGDTITAKVVSAKDDFWLEDVAKAK